MKPELLRPMIVGILAALLAVLTAALVAASQIQVTPTRTPDHLVLVLALKETAAARAPLPGAGPGARTDDSRFTWLRGEVARSLVYLGPLFALGAVLLLKRAGPVALLLTSLPIVALTMTLGPTSTGSSLLAATIVAAVTLKRLLASLSQPVPEPQQPLPQFTDATTRYAVLIHGTFAPKARWTEDDSAFALRVREMLKGEVTVVPFAWTGTNTIGARATAVKQLLELVQTLHKASPAARLILVGHSHGGNIALAAVKEPGLPDCIAAVITLGTPFLAVTAKRWAPPFVYALSLAMWVAVALNFLTPLAFYMSGSDSIVALWALVGLATFTLTFICAALVLGRAMRRLPAMSVEQQGRPVTVPVICIRHGLDEAALWLGILAIPRTAERILSFVGSVLVGHGVRQAAILISLVMALPLAGAADALPLSLRIALIVLVLLVMLIPPLSVLGTIVSSHRFGFGGNFSVRHLSTDVKLTTTAHVELLGTVKFSGVLGMMRALSLRPFRFATPHSLGYSDPKAIRVAALWARALLR